MNELNSTLPDTRAKKAIIARSRQLTDFKWTPIRDVPTYLRTVGNTVLPAGVEVTGFPYSSTEQTDKFFTENVSFESFLSAIPNPDSKLYIPGQGAFNCCNFGIVCNGLVRYAFGIERRVNTKCWPTIPGMRCVAKRQEYKVDDIELCDVLYAYGEGRNHVALITDILRNENGKIALVEVSEAIRPLCARRQFAPEEFYEKYKLFALYRYDLIDTVPDFDDELDRLLWESGIENKTPQISVDNGNKSNYLFGEEILISVFSDEPDVIELYKNGELIEEIKFGARAMIPRRLGRGYYVAKLKNANESVEFCVNKAKIGFSVEDGNITVTADPCDEKSEILYMDFRVDGIGYASLAEYEELTQEEKTDGRFTRAIPFDGKNFRVYFKNKYGVWVHPMTKIQ